MLIKKIKVCSVCGVTSNESKNMLTTYNQFKKELCTKHYGQLKAHGKITDSSKLSIRSRYEINEYIYYDDYVEICMYNSDGAESARAIIDIEDVEKPQQYKWRLSDAGYAVTTYKRKTTYLHRIIMSPPLDKVIDHINRDTLDNRKVNLRICDNSENIRNSKKPITNTSGYMGVCWIDRVKKWRARIGFNKKGIYLGYYTNIEDAIEARKKAEEKYFGEFAPKHNT